MLRRLPFICDRCAAALGAPPVFQRNVFMPQATDMYYRNSFFYVLTQVIGVSLLLCWLAYSIEYTSLDMAVSAR